MQITYMEVIDNKGVRNIHNGQLLPVVRRTAHYMWIRADDGTEYQVSKQTKRINGTVTDFFRTPEQPVLNY